MSKARQRTQGQQQPLLSSSIDDISEIDSDGKKSNQKEYVVVGALVVVILLFCFKDRVQSTVTSLRSSGNGNLNFNRDYSQEADVNSFAGAGKESLVDEITAEELHSDVPVLTQHITSEDAPLNIVFKQLESKCDDMIIKIRAMKRTGVVMETDENAKNAIIELQNELRKMMRMKYGPTVSTFKVAMELEFPPTMPDFVEAGSSGTIVIESAPIDFVPYSVYMFLKIVNNFKSGSFHRNAGHVLQAMVTAKGLEGMAFQEYSPSFPHARLTMGYAGRPGGPAFYISTVDNTNNHGPGSQGSGTEADGCFGRVLDGEDVVKRMQKQPGKTKPSGFIDKPQNYIKILSLQLIEPKQILE